MVKFCTVLEFSSGVSVRAVAIMNFDNPVKISQSEIK